MEETKYSGNFVKVTEEKIDSNIWEKVYLQDAVQVFPITEDGKVYLIEEKRPHELTLIRLKFVTGLMDKPNEDPLETAHRELQEEIGLKANEYSIINHSKRTGTINQNFYQIVARGLSSSKIPNPDGEDTIVSVKAYSTSEIIELFETKRIQWDLSALMIMKIQKALLSNNVEQLFKI